MFIFQTSLSGTRFSITVFPNQSVETDLTKDIADVKVTGPMPKLTSFPVGYNFIATKFEVHGGEHIHIIEAEPILDLDKNLIVEKDAAGNITPNSMQQLDFFFTYATDSTEYNEETTKNLAKTVGFDLEKFNAELEKKRGTKVNIRKTIAKKYPLPDEKDTGFYIDKDKWDLLIRNYLRGENTLVTGPTGSGKTEIISLVAQTLGVSINIQDMGTVQDAQSALLGVHRLNKDGHSIFDPAPFVSHIQQPGILLLDEMNRAPLAANNILFPCLDRRRYLPLDIASAEELRHVPVHEEAVFFATANIGSEYSGVFQIDRALLDRFFPVEMDYPKEDAEARVLTLRTGIDKKIATSIVKCCATIRNSYKQQELSNTVSVRHSLQIASLIVDGFKPEQAMFAVLLPLFEDSITSNSERSKIKSIVAAY